MNKQDIMEEIDILEHSDTTYQNCSKLAVLYTIYDHFAPALSTPELQNEDISEQPYAESEFIKTYLQCPQDVALKVLDEHMDAIRLLHPKEYSAIIQKLRL